MGDADSPAPLHSDPRFLVATTLATLLLAGSAFICRTGSRPIWSAYTSGPSHQTQALGSDSKSTAAGSDQDTRDGKVSRPKERRRRGKDPLKDLLKKKSKLLQVPKPGRSFEQENLPKIDQQPSHLAHDNGNSLQFESPSSLPPPPSANSISNPSPFPPSSSSTSTSTSSPSPVTSPNTSPTLSQSQIDSRTPTLNSHDTTLSKSGTAETDPWVWDGAGPSTTSVADPHLTPQRHQIRKRSNSKETESRSSSLSSPSIVMLPALDEGEEEGVEPKRANGAPNGGTTVTSPTSTNTTTTPATPRRAPTPRDRRPPTPLSRSGTPPPQTQLASMRGALEAARLREEKLRVEVERYSKEVEALRWEGGRARRREGELQAQIHHLMNQLQAYSAMLAGQVSPHPLSPHASHHIPSPSSANGTNGASPTPGPSLNGYATFSPPTSSPHSPPPPPPQHPHLHIPSAQAQMLLNTILPSPTMPFHGHGHSPHPSSFYAVPGGYPASPMQSPHGLYSMMFASMPAAAAAAAVGNGLGAGTGVGVGTVMGTGTGMGAVEPGGSGSGGEETGSVGSESPELEGGSEGFAEGERERGRRRTRNADGPFGGWEEGGDGWVDAGVGVQLGTGAVITGEPGEGYRDGDGDGMGEEEERLNEVLADAILKRPGSIRGLSRLGKVKGSGGGAEKEREKEFPLEEFRFPSISDFGNVVRAPQWVAPLYETERGREGFEGLAGAVHEEGGRVDGELEVELGSELELELGLDDMQEEGEGQGKEDLTPPAPHPPPPSSRPPSISTSESESASSQPTAMTAVLQSEDAAGDGVQHGYRIPEAV